MADERTDDRPDEREIEGARGDLGAVPLRAPDRERALEERAHDCRYAELFEHSPNACVVTDGLGMIVEGNSRAAWLLGTSGDLLGNRPLGAFIHADDRHRFMRRIAEMRAGTIGRVVDEPLRFQVPEIGATNEIRVSAVLRRLAGSSSIRILWSLVEVTGDRASDRAAGRNEVERLRRLDGLKDLLLSAVSHELKQPVSSLVGFTTTLQQHGDVLPAQERDRIHARLVANARRAQELIEDLLDHQRWTRGTVEPSREPVDLQAVVADVLAGLETPDRVRVRVGNEDGPEVIRADAGMVERIVDNLVRNAFAHTPDDAPVTIEISSTDEGALITVRDDGPGVDPDLLQDVFEPFVRSDAGGGTGLGLTIVREFAEIHGGRAWVENHPHGGALFRVLLPDS